MFQISNSTPFATGTFILPDERGADTLLLVVKGTFAIEPDRVRLAKEQRKLALADTYWGEPDASSLKYASDVHLPKRATDVALVGSAYAPGGRAMPEFSFSLSVGPVKRVIRVFGDRSAGARGPTAAVPVAAIPLTYERAYGGMIKLADGRVDSEPRNPVGRGFRGQGGGREPRGAGALLPNLVDPRQVGDPAAETVIPIGVGYIAPAWEPRRSLAGTYDARWVEERSPFLPDDFDARFLQAASAGMVVEGRLRGGEPVEIINGAPPPQAVLRFALPRVEIDAEIRAGAQRERPVLALNTLLFEPDEAVFSMTWVGAFPCHNRAPRIDRVTLGPARLEGVVE